LTVTGLRIGEASDAGGSYSGQAGYRASGYLRGTRWLSEALGVAVAIGVEYQFSTAHGPQDFMLGPSQEYVQMWHAEPALAVLGLYRFGQ
jgi:hypothetical protein